MRKFYLLVVAAVFALGLGSLTSCVAIKASNGNNNPPAQSKQFACEQKCGYYDTSKKPIGVDDCLSNCKE